MKTRMIFLVAILATSAVDVLAAVKIKCAPASDVVSAETKLEDYEPFFSANKIIPKSDLSVNLVEQFKNEYLKFPESLRSELLDAGAKIHIMEGEGVTVDPTWHSESPNTFDGRPWSQVPGAGGSTARAYLKTPTRIVLNHFYDRHGSVNLFLHEHAHTLDSIDSLLAISNSNVWKELKTSVPNFQKFLSEVCGKYCTNNIEEGFAEYFANYHACKESREQMEREVPRVAEFFKRFNSTVDLENIWNDQSSTKIDTSTRIERLRRRAERIIGRLIPRPGLDYPPEGH